MSLAQWLLALHVTAAFLLVGGTVVAATFRVLAQTRERPSEIALFLGLTRVAVIAIGIGSFTTLLLGLWMVHHFDFSYGDFWVWASVILWAVAMALGGRGGRTQEGARVLAQRLASEGEAPSSELRALLHDPRANAMSYGSGVLIVVILVLMIWKPGA